MKVTIFDANELAGICKIAKKVFVFSALLNDHAEVQKDNFIEQLHFLAQDGEALPNRVIADMDNHGFLWID